MGSIPVAGAKRTRYAFVCFVFLFVLLGIEPERAFGGISDIANSEQIRNEYNFFHIKKSHKAAAFILCIVPNMIFLSNLSFLKHLFILTKSDIFSILMCG